MKRRFFFFSLNLPDKKVSWETTSKTIKKLIGHCLTSSKKTKKLYQKNRSLLYFGLVRGPQVLFVDWLGSLKHPDLYQLRWDLYQELSQLRFTCLLLSWNKLILPRWLSTNWFNSTQYPFWLLFFIWFLILKTEHQTKEKSNLASTLFLNCFLENLLTIPRLYQPINGLERIAEPQMVTISNVYTNAKSIKKLCRQSHLFISSSSCHCLPRKIR